MEEYFSALAKYNFWDSHVPQLGFLRKEYTDNIEILDYLEGCFPESNIPKQVRDFVSLSLQSKY